jgi:cytochrome c nitrite reductase small subunit
MMAQRRSHRTHLSWRPWLAWPVAAAVGAVVGLGGFTFVYARGYSYLTDDPAACANCHVMEEQFQGWSRGSHRSVAVCNDCHTPAGALGKYSTKAANGFWHSYYFTVGGFPDPIQMTPRNRAVTEAACLKCHAEITSAIAAPAGVTIPARSGAPAAGHGAPGISCVRCHASAGHLR